MIRQHVAQKHLVGDMSEANFLSTIKLYMKQIGLIGTWLVFCLDGVEKIFSRPKKGKVKYILLSVVAAYIINISTGT
ncbi:hypothetical protein J0L31_04660 [Terrisporobacter glycolicus]|nr:hypothetical protein [Terrisporobacter glycolicus]